MNFIGKRACFRLRQLDFTSSAKLSIGCCAANAVMSQPDC